MVHWRIVALLAVGSALCLSVTGFTVELWGLSLAVAAVLGCAALASFYATHRPAPRLSAVLTAVGQLAAVSVTAGPLSYAAASRGAPLWDATFAAWDRSLGLDWLGYVAFVDGHPWLAWVERVAYESFKHQILVVPVVLGLSGRMRALRIYVLAYALTSFATVLMSTLMPASEMWAYLGLDPAAFPNVSTTAPSDDAAIFHALRDGDLRNIALDRLEGVVTFPSFHAATAVLVVVALWPVRALRWPVLALNAAMLAASPIYGGHYFADVGAGAALAGLWLVVAQAACHSLGSRRDDARVAA